MKTDRRSFMQSAALAGASVALSLGGAPEHNEKQSFVPRRRQAHDRIALGKTGIQVSRVAMGTGTRGAGKESDQTRMGSARLTRLLRHGFDEGITFWDAADQYGSHACLAAGLIGIDRSKVVILTKTNSETPRGIREDLDRFRTELRTDYIDIVLLHAMGAADWPQRLEGAMDALSEAKQKGVIRAHGVSCHSIHALRSAAECPWVDVDLARINPAGIAMDERPRVVISVLEKMKARGKGVVGMKVFAQGELSEAPDRALRHAAQLEALDAFTIGFMSPEQVNHVVNRLPVVSLES